MDDPHDLERFLFAQETTFERALAELRAGRKQGHWMWYVFPQLRGLGHSRMSEMYGIVGLAEAEAYLHHPVLGHRLLDCAHAAAAASCETAADLLGPVDAVKLRSCMTLFSLAAAEASHEAGVEVFGIVLDRYYDGVPDAATVSALSA